VLRPKLVTIRDARDKHINKLIQLTTSTSAIFTLPLIGKCSIVTRVYVCLSVCVCMFVVRNHIFGTTSPIFTNFLCMLPMAVARSVSGSFVIR